MCGIKPYQEVDLSKGDVLVTLCELLRAEGPAQRVVQ
jgi:hypothetical protein